MTTLETTDSREANRCRIAQFVGKVKTLSVSGTKVTGRVYAVKEDDPKKPTRWTITVITN